MGSKPQPPPRPVQLEPELRLDGASASEASLAQAIVEAMDRRVEEQKRASDSQWGMFKRIVRWKDVGAVIVFAASLIVGAYVTYQELAAKPSTADMTEAIEVRVRPVEDAVEEQTGKIEKIDRKVDKLETGTNQILEEMKFQGTQLNCLGDRKCKKMPERKAPDIEIGVSR